MAEQKQGDIDMKALEGKRIRNKQNGKVYLILNANARWIPNPDTYNNLFTQNLNDSGDAITDYDDAIMKGMAFGTDLPNGCMLFKAKDAAPVWLTDDLLGLKQKRHIADPNTMDKYSFSWDKIKSYPEIIVDSIPTGAQIDGK